MQNAIEGTLTKVLETEAGTSQGGKDWSKRLFVIKTDDKYPKDVCFTLFGEKVSLINDHKVGDKINVSFNLSSREFNGKFYHNIDAWKVDASSGEGVTSGEWKSPNDENLSF